MNATLAAVRARVVDQGEAANRKDGPFVTAVRRGPFIGAVKLNLEVEAEVARGLLRDRCRGRPRQRRAS
jgi:hypothetical protein